ncbi:MAG: GtrA family protein [bacterium]|nr:GtrA family protein [bacterium]
MKKDSNTKKEVAQVGRFGLVGILNTVIDIVLQNILFQFFGLTKVIAALISGTAAMINSFIFNQRFTFRAKKTDTLHIFYFFAITLFGLYIIRPLVIIFFTRIWLWPADTAYKVLTWLHVPIPHSVNVSAYDATVNYIGLFMAILVVLIYNYLLYRKVVFKNGKK